MWPFLFSELMPKKQKRRPKERNSVNMDNKDVESNLVNTRRFWNNLHQVLSKLKDWKAK